MGREGEQVVEGHASYVVIGGRGMNEASFCSIGTALAARPPEGKSCSSSLQLDSQNTHLVARSLE